MPRTPSAFTISFVPEEFLMSEDAMSECCGCDHIAYHELDRDIWDLVGSDRE